MRKLPAWLAFVATLLSLSGTALAAAPGDTVTLDASQRTIAIGHRVTLSGTIDPATGGEAIEIRDEAGTVVATATTGGGGAFSVTIRPTATRGYHAVWGSATSDPVRVRVRARVSTEMTRVRLFDEVTIRGRVRPARPGRRVEVQLLLGGRATQSRRVVMGAAGRFATRFRIMRPGVYRARATFTGADLLRARDVTRASSTPLPSLHTGSRGVYVRLLEQRLLDLDYRLVDTTDGRYDLRTADAVVAFHKVQRMPRTFSVDAATWRALADPRRPHPRYTWHGRHIEVDQTRQVAMVVEDGDVTAIFHVSTGKPSTPTHDGLFRVNRKIAGYSAHRLYYPSYFDGNRALHGWPEVPTYAASHGCVRIPYWNALWVFDLATIGTRVAVYH